ncbi:MAG: glycosyltransferase family 2 protein, partial [Terriglobales bacterium]
RKPLVSVLLPTHNRADVLGYAIATVLWQTEQDFELLIVGDGCTDETAKVVASFHDERVCWFDLPKAPLSGYANRNKVLRRARGRYVAYAQHDDIFFPDHLAKLIATIEASEAEWCYSRPLWCTSDGYCVPFAINLGNADELAHFLNVENHIPSCCVLHTRKALKRVGYWPEDVERLADWRCWHHIIQTSASQTVAYCREATALHFRASWKSGPEQDPIAVSQLHAIAQSATWWPSALKLDVPPGSAEQGIFFETICPDGVASEARIAELRAGITLVLDRLAWTWIKEAGSHLT